MSSTTGRGATANTTSTRFKLPTTEVDGDWLDDRDTIDGAPPPLRTTVSTLAARTIITRNTSPDIGFDRSINAYNGCEHGCIYCFARPSHAWHDLSPGVDFESRLFAKPDAVKLLRRELSAPGYRVAPLAIGTNTDPYQPIERDWNLTRGIVEVMAETGHPLIITTKSDRILRDLPLLADMAARNLVIVAISVTSLDPAIARTLEPRAPHPQRRLDAVRRLSEAGVPTQVNIAPIIPAITDHEIEAILSSAAQAGAVRASRIVVRLPHEVAPLFRAWLNTHFPDRADKVMNIIRSMRDGRDNDPRFGQRMKGSGPWAALIATRFRRAARLYGLDGPPTGLDCTRFVPPPRDGQLRLF